MVRSQVAVPAGAFSVFTQWAEVVKILIVLPLFIPSNVIRFTGCKDAFQGFGYTRGDTLPAEAPPPEPATIEKPIAVLDPPAGGGLLTVILDVPTLAKSLVGITALNVIVLIYVVANGDPFQLTTEAEMKFVPVTVRVIVAVLPAVAKVCDNDDNVGRGFPTAKLRLFDGPPPGIGLTTVTATFPPMLKSDAGTLRRNVVPFTNVGVLFVPFH